jgi:uncharacterized protein YidB (DUF937 family)
MVAKAGILAALDAVVAELTAAGLRASINPAKLTPPAVWVSLDKLIPELLDGNGAAQIRVNLIVPDTTLPQGLDALDQLLAKVWAVLPLAVEDVTPEGVVLPDSPNPLPSLRVTVQVPYTRTT